MRSLTRDKNLFGFNTSTSIQCIRNFLSQIGASLHISVSRVRLWVAQFGGAVHQPAQNVLRDGLRRVANSQTNDAARHVGVFFHVRAATSTNLGKQVASREFGKVGVALDHGER